MKRDLSIIYSFLNCIASQDTPSWVASEDKIALSPIHQYNMELAMNEGLVREIHNPEISEARPGSRTLTLTWKGHRFLDLVETIGMAEQPDSTEHAVALLMKAISLALL